MRAANCVRTDVVAELARGVRRRLRRRLLPVRGGPLARRERTVSWPRRQKTPGGMVAILKADPEEVEEALGETEGSVVANYNSPTRPSSRSAAAVGDAVSRIRRPQGAPQLSFAAHSPPWRRQREDARGPRHRRVPQARVPIVSAIDRSGAHERLAVKEA